MTLRVFKDLLKNLSVITKSVLVMLSPSLLDRAECHPAHTLAAEAEPETTLPFLRPLSCCRRPVKRLSVSSCALCAGWLWFGNSPAQSAGFCASVCQGPIAFWTKD